MVEAPGAHEAAVGIGLAVLADRRDQVAQPQPGRAGDRVARVWSGCRPRRAAPCRVPVRRRGSRPVPPWLNDLVVGDVDRDVEDRRFAAAPPLRPAQRDVEQLLALDHRGEGLAAQRRLDDVVDVGGADAPALALVRVDAELQVRSGP